MRTEAQPGQIIALDASGSNDPDGDGITVRWWVYSEAGTYPGEITVSDPYAMATSVTIAEDAAGSEIHIILEIQDKNPIASLSDYRRLVITVL